MKKISIFLLLVFVFSAAIFAETASNTLELKSPKLPNGAPRFDYTVEEIRNLASNAQKIFEGKMQEIIAIPAKDRTFENTVRALEWAESDFFDTTNVAEFMSSVSTASEVREEANKLEENNSKFLVEIQTKRELFDAVNEFAQKNVPLASEDAFLLERTLLGFKRNGLALPEKELNEFKELKKRAVELEIKFEKNIRDFKDQIEVTKEQLDGLPEDYTKKLKKTDDGKFIITMDYPDFFPFMEKAKNEEARRLLEFKFSNRCASDNVLIMEEVLQLREKMAKMLGYKNHSEFILEDRMAKKPEVVSEFLDRLQSRLTPKAKEELKQRLELKAKELNVPVPEEMKNWDWRYWNDRFRKVTLDLDQEKVREYFPVETVIKGMLEVFQEVFDVKMKKAEVPVWHEDVRAFEVTEKNGEVIGYLYLDLFPREGKYKHGACFPLLKGRLLPDGTYQKPSAAIVANFNKPSPEIPSLLKHDEVETLFHEFGHVTHNLFTRAKYGSFSGTKVFRDFVEVPSTLLENWAWNPVVLKRVSGHFKNPDEKIPDDLIKKLIEGRNIDSGIVHLRQVFFSKLDIVYHTSEPKNTTETYEKLMKSIMLIPMSPGVHPQASFGHLMGGYDSGYYGYLWARVISSDLFGKFETEGILNPEVGKRYRNLILARGRTPDPGLEVEQFLGRKFSEDAFIKSIGLAK